MHPTDPSTLDGANGFRIGGVAADDDVGLAVANAGDLNGDGFADLIIGAGGADEAFLIFGKESGFDADLDLSALDAADGVLLTGGAFDLAQMQVSAAGDVNGDGFADVALGAPGDQTAFVIFGQASFGATLALADLDGSDGFAIDASDFGASAAFDVAGAGDVNGDGFADVIVASPYGDPSAAGVVHVVFGQAAGFLASLDLDALDATAGFRMAGAANGDNLGLAVDRAGDVNGDGLDDLIVTAPGADAAAGAAFVLFGSDAGFDLDADLAALDGGDGFRIAGLAAADALGRGAAALGDVNGDGVGDFAVASDLAGDGGEVFVVFGRTGGFEATFDLAALDGSDGFRVDGADAGDAAGFVVAGVGDVNGDGLADFAIGAPSAAGGAGETYVMFGRASGFDPSFALADFDETDGFRVDGLIAGDALGADAGGGGDIDGDGLDDLIVGAPGGAGATGAASVFFGADFGAITHLGNEAKNILTGTDDDDVMVLGQGSDEFDAGRGNDVVRGGEGFDTGDLGSGNDRAFGGAGKDTLNGQSGDDVLYGEDGNDTLDLGSGNDSAFGGPGDDKIFVRADELGAGDRIVGGEGDRDIFFLQSGGLVDLTDLDAFEGIERVKVASNQTIVSVDLDIKWFGRAGDETFLLGAGRDIVKASGGDDVILGGDGNDRLFGQSGNDRIGGEAGNDKMKGQEGADTFIFGLGSGRDKIYDFTKGEDVLDVQGYGFEIFALDIIPRLADIGGKAVINLSATDRVVLVGISSGDLAATDFVLDTPV